MTSGTLRDFLAPLISPSHHRCRCSVKIFIPSFVVASLQPPQSNLLPKFGGLPWGFPAAKWPVCRECESQMVLLAQLPHDPSVGLDFGDEAYVLHLFQCPTGGCSSYAYGEGCTASLILRCEHLGDGLTQPPYAGPPKPNPYVSISRTNADGGEEVAHFLPPPMNGELWITGWAEFEDDIRPDQRAVYYDGSKFDDASDEEREPYRKFLQAGEDAGKFRTKAGGFPYWGRHGAAPPQGSFEFLLQIDTFIHIDGSLPKPEQVGCDVFLQTDKSGYDPDAHLRAPEEKKKPNAPWNVQQLGKKNEFTAEFANFGTCGAAYVFIDREQVPPKVIWAWSR
jgi:hypothetical protein